MPNDVDRLLARAPLLGAGPSLGRIFSVVCESWLLSEDPQQVSPRTDLLASRRTALEAADLARDAAEAFAQHGFHKRSGAWWGSDGVRVHRFAVRVRRAAGGGILLSTVAAAIGAVATVTLLNGAQKARKKARSRA